VIELTETDPTLDEIMGLAKDGVVVLRKPDGSAFAVAQLDDFEIEVELLRNRPDFLGFLRQLSREDAAISLEDLRKELPSEGRRFPLSAPTAARSASPGAVDQGSARRTPSPCKTQSSSKTA
jgi:hypothetical protein